MILLDYFYLYDVELPTGAERWLIRVGRPAAPNPNGAACTLAELIIDAKAETLLCSALAELGQRDAPRELALVSTKTDAEFGSFHGSAHRELWVVVDGEPGREAFDHLLFGAHDRDIEADIDALVELGALDFRVQRQPAQRSEVRLITEVDYDLLDCAPMWSTT